MSYEDEDFGEQRDYKAERDTLIDDIDWQQKKIEKLEDEKDDMLLEREYYNNRYKDTMRICKELEDENKQLKESRDWDYEYIVKVNEENKRLEREIRKLRVKSDSFFESWRFKSVMYTDLSKESDKYKTLLSEISQHIGNKPSSSTYKYFRGKLNALEIRGGE